MSRVANEPILVPKNVEVTLKDGAIAVKGVQKGTLQMVLQELSPLFMATMDA